MNYHDGLRPRLANGRECWLDSAIALPTIDVSPGKEGSPDPYSLRWNIRVMNGGNGRWYFTSLLIDELGFFLRSWVKDPEGTWKDFFAEEPPRGMGSGSVSSPSIAVPTTAKTLEDLGF